MTPANPSHPQWRGKVLMVSVAGALVLGWLTWTAWAGRVADQVSASWSLRRCEGTTVGSYQGDPAIRSRPGWTCDVALDIVNESGHAVHVKAVEAALMGTAGRAEVQGKSSPDGPIRDVDAAGGHSRFGDVDAVWQVHDAIPARSHLSIDLPIGWRETGCDSAGHLHIDRWPTIVFEALGRTYRYSPQQRLVLRTYDDPHDATACPQ